MTDPVLHLIAGPNGSGKSTLYAKVIAPVVRLEFVNADVIAADRWPGAEIEHAYDAARIAAQRRAHLIAGRASFVTETVFSHASKVQLLIDAETAGYRTTLHIVSVPVDLAVARVRIRAALGGHNVPEDKIRARFARLWPHIADAIAVVDEANLYDNTSDASPFRLVARWFEGALIGAPQWPRWTPAPLSTAGR